MVQTLVAWIVLPLCYYCTTPAANINWVFGPGTQPQTWMAPFHYFLLVMGWFSVRRVPADAPPIPMVVQPRTNVRTAERRLSSPRAHFIWRKGCLC